MQTNARSFEMCQGVLVCADISFYTTQRNYSARIKRQHVSENVRLVCFNCCM